METLIMNDGTVVSNTATMTAVVGLWIHIFSGMNLPEAFRLFSDQSKTTRIESDKTEPHRPDERTVYEGYTSLFMMKQEENGEIVIGLHKG